MSKLIDISVPLTPQLPKWPGSSGFKMVWTKRIDTGDDCNNSQIECDSHTGTHIDAPFHFLRNGKALDRIALDVFMGPCRVIYIHGQNRITAEVLSEHLANDYRERIILRTDNSSMWADQTKAFTYEYACLTPDGAAYLVERNIRLIGIDYLSIGDMENGAETHRILCEADIVILEGLNLESVAPGAYELICLPLNIQGAEGAPARAILRPEVT